MIPLVATVLLIVAMPWLQNGVEMIRLHCNYLLEKYRERKNVEFESVAKQNTELNKLKDNTTNELKHRIVNSKISVNDIFIGRWKIEIIEEDKHTEFKGCELRSNKFFNDSGEVLTIQPISFPEENNSNIHNFIARANIKVGSQSQWFIYSLRIDSRNLIRFNKNQIGESIKLTWEGIY